MATRPAAMDTTTMHNDSPMDHMQGEMYIHKVKRDDVMDLVEELQEYRNDLANQGSASILTQRKCRDSLTSMDLRHRHWYTLLCGRWDILVTSLVENICENYIFRKPLEWCHKVSKIPLLFDNYEPEQDEVPLPRWKVWLSHLPCFTTTLILASAVIIGNLTREDLSDHTKLVLQNFELSFLWIFTVEAAVELLGCGGYHPVTDVYVPDVRSYFDKGWNIFDFVVILACHIGGKHIQVVRLLRLLRIIESMDELAVLVAGMYSGGRFIGAILLMLLLVFFSFAVVGQSVFKPNDPTHFNSLEVSMLSLFRSATMEDWTDIMYINMFGCDEYGYESHEQDCVDPSGHVIFAPLYFSLLMFTCNLIYMNLFVAVVTTSMTAATSASEASSTKLSEQEELHVKARPEDIEFVRWMLAAYVMPEETKSKKTWSYYLSNASAARARYLHCANMLKAWTLSRPFQNIIGSIIMLAAVTIGISISEPEGSLKTAADVLELVTIIFFTVEFLLKVLAEGMHPWLYFIGRNKFWNTFDFGVLVLSIVPTSREGALGLRVLRLMKLVNNVETMAIIMEGVVRSMRPMCYMVMLVVLVFYIFAVTGINLFRDNDPWHFKDIPRTMLTLLRCASGDDWTDVMYINIYGCDRYPWNNPGDAFGAGYLGQSNGVGCENPKGHGVTAALYFLLFIVTVALVMLNLFVGIVTSNISQVMERLTQKQRNSEKMKILQRVLDIKEAMSRKYAIMFNLIDASKDEMCSKAELLEVFKRSMNQVDCSKMISAVDVDNRNELDLSEVSFLFHVVHLKMVHGLEMDDVVYKVEEAVHKRVSDRGDTEKAAVPAFSDQSLHLNAEGSNFIKSSTLQNNLSTREEIQREMEDQWETVRYVMEKRGIATAEIQTLHRFIRITKRLREGMSGSSWLVRAFLNETGQSRRVSKRSSMFPTVPEHEQPEEHEWSKADATVELCLESEGSDSLSSKHPINRNPILHPNAPHINEYGQPDDTMATILELPGGCPSPDCKPRP